jgi:hypothetical protein
MLSPAIVEEVQRLLKEGKLSWRKIAGRTGVSRGSVHAIAHGRRAVRPRQPRDSADATGHSRSPGDAAGRVRGVDMPIGFEGPIGRCGRCGRRMVLPCRACHITHMKDLGLIQRPTRRRGGQLVGHDLDEHARHLPGPLQEIGPAE